MIIGFLDLSLRLPGVRSLKEKRHLLRGLLEKTQRDFGISISETADHDLWGNASIGAACVATNAAQAESLMRTVFHRFDEHPEIEVHAFLVDVIHTD